MECDMHIFTISCSENTQLLCLALIFLWQYSCTLHYMCMWLPGQLISIRRMCRVGFKYPGRCDFFLNRKKCYILTFVLFLCHYSPDSPHLQSVVSNAGPGKSSITPLVRCTRHMCPIRVHCIHFLVAFLAISLVNWCIVCQNFVKILKPCILPS